MEIDAVRDGDDDDDEGEVSCVCGTAEFAV